jgi:hypothetical protein
VFWIVRPDYGDNNLPAYGLVDEASKVNLISAPREMLRAFRIMPDDLPDCIFDWKDNDSDIEFNGVEDEYYLSLANPYHCKNDNFESVEELLLVKGAYPELLYGTGMGGSNAYTTAASPGAGAGGMQIGGLSDQDLESRGLFQYLTVYSREPNPSGNGTRVGRINVNTAPREVLRCLPGLTDADVSSLASKRDSNGFGQIGTTWVQQALAQKAGSITQYITGESYQFSADIVAASADGRAFRRVRIVVDAVDANNRPKILYRQDLTDRGWPLQQGVLESLKSGTLMTTGAVPMTGGGAGPRG